MENAKTTNVQPEQATREKNSKLLNSSFLLLIQGQFVSAIGDKAYDIALGFWILATTGSTGLMGTLVAAAMLPRAIISPFAGTLADRIDRKAILVLMDLVRGAVISFIAIAAFRGFIQLWMVFAAGLLLGICSCFFGPAVSSSLPDLVPKSKLVKAYSILNMASSSSKILGDSMGGYLYQLLGAPVMFLINGVSFIFSGFCNLFIKLPKQQSSGKKPAFFADMKAGIAFINTFKGLKLTFVTLAFINFFSGIISVLTLPFFNQMEYLGATKYGMAMACMSLGGLLGFAYLSSAGIKPRHKTLAFCMSGIITQLLMIIYVMIKQFLVIASIFLIDGFTGSVLVVCLMSSTQATVPQNMRGKVSGNLSTLSAVLYPLAMAVGGLLAEIIPIAAIVIGSASVLLVMFIYLYFNRDIRKFMSFEPDKQVLEDIL